MKREFNWSQYYNNHLNSKTTSTLLKGLKYFNQKNTTLEKKCMDIGCGQGTDTIELLKQGWNVIAVDKEEEAKKIITTNHPELCKKNLKIIIKKMEDISIKETSIINASYSLPFCNPKKFSILWKKITTNLSVGGLFCGQLFGIEDSWSKIKTMTFHHRCDLDDLFNNFRMGIGRTCY